MCPLIQKLDTILNLMQYFISFVQTHTLVHIRICYYTIEWKFNFFSFFCPHFNRIFHCCGCYLMVKSFKLKFRFKAIFILEHKCVLYGGVSLRIIYYDHTHVKKKNTVKPLANGNLRD